MLPQIIPDAYRNLLRRGKIGEGADQVAAGDHVQKTLEWKNKPNTEIVNNSTVLQDDNDIRGITLEKRKYHLRGILFVLTTAVAGLKTEFLFSGSLQTSDDVLLQAYDMNDALIANFFGGFFNTTRVFTYAADLTAEKAIIFDGIINVTGAGDLKLQWAQQTAEATDTRLIRNSFLKLDFLP